MSVHVILKIPEDKSIELPDEDIFGGRVEDKIYSEMNRIIQGASPIHIIGERSEHIIPPTNIAYVVKFKKA